MPLHEPGPVLTATAVRTAWPTPLNGSDDPAPEHRHRRFTRPGPGVGSRIAGARSPRAGDLAAARRSGRACGCRTAAVAHGPGRPRTRSGCTARLAHIAGHQPARLCHPDQQRGSDLRTGPAVRRRVDRPRPCPARGAGGPDPAHSSLPEGDIGLGRATQGGPGFFRTWPPCHGRQRCLLRSKGRPGPSGPCAGAGRSGQGQRRQGGLTGARGHRHRDAAAAAQRRPQPFRRTGALPGPARPGPARHPGPGQQPSCWPSWIDPTSAPTRWRMCGTHPPCAPESQARQQGISAWKPPPWPPSRRRACASGSSA